MQPIYPESEFLFARPSFLQGVATLFDLGGNLIEYNHSLDERQADERALAADWNAVGKDIRNAIETAQKEEAASTNTK